MNDLGLPDALAHSTVWGALKNSLAEDLDADGDPSHPLSAHDLTSRATLPDNAEISATLIAKEDGVVAGIPLLRALFSLVDERIQLSTRVSDGTSVSRGDELLTLRGRAQSILTGERSALNMTGRCSGIATLAHRFTEAVDGTEATILDTRKTTPGLRRIEKYAVSQGGAENHRMGLFDMVLIKENHIEAAGGIESSVNRVRNTYGDRYPVEVEVKDLDELRQALAVQVDRIMLDNMHLSTMAEAVEIAQGAVPLEASGNVSLDTVRAIAETGVDYISVGALTHSAITLDLSLLIR